MLAPKSLMRSRNRVKDPDFAMQFIGRVMRVARPVRDAFARQAQIAPELNTAYVYLANAQAQAGFEAAVQATSAVQSALQVDILPALKSGDSCCQTAMPRRENVFSSVHVAVVYRPALAARPFPYSQTRPTFRTAGGYHPAARASLG
jgi:hypothetical protein